MQRVGERRLHQQVARRRHLLAPRIRPGCGCPRWLRILRRRREQRLRRSVVRRGARTVRRCRSIPRRLRLAPSVCIGSRKDVRGGGGRRCGGGGGAGGWAGKSSSARRARRGGERGASRGARACGCNTACTFAAADVRSRLRLGGTRRLFLRVTKIEHLYQQRRLLRLRLARTRIDRRGGACGLGRSHCRCAPPLVWACLEVVLLGAGLLLRQLGQLQARFVEVGVPARQLVAVSLGRAWGAHPLQGSHDHMMRSQLKLGRAADYEDGADRQHNDGG